MFDLHVHTFMCGHARGSIEELVQSAIALGLSEIGIADHMPLIYTDDRTLAMARDELPTYVETVLGLKEQFRGQIDILLGIEADYYPSTVDEVERLIEAHPFDYVIGSVHRLGDWNFDSPLLVERYNEIDIDEFFLEYLQAEMDMVSTGIFDIVSHPDLVKKFGNRPAIDPSFQYRKLLEKMRDAGICYEINTSGLRWPAGEMYPESKFISIAFELGVPVTLGSDSHCPEDVGRDLERAIRLLKDTGYKEVATFRNRKMRLVPLS